MSLLRRILSCLMKCFLLLLLIVSPHTIYQTSHARPTTSLLRMSLILTRPPPPPSAPDPSLIPCPNCGRSFGEQAAERHIPKCASIRAKPTMLKKGAGIAAGAAGAAMSGAAAVRAQMAPASRNSAPIQQPPMNTTSLRGSQQQQQQQQQQTSMTSSRVGGGGGGRIPDIPNVPATFSGSFASNRQRGR